MPAEIVATSTLRDGWIRVLSVRMRLKAGVEVDREVEDHGRGVAVLPYDPTRRVALLVRLPRPAVLLSDGQGQVLEAPAGYVEESDPDDTARRELYEETGLRLRRVHHLGTVWVSPGIRPNGGFVSRALFARRSGQSRRRTRQREREHYSHGGTACTVVVLVQAKRITDMKMLTLILMLHTQERQLFAAT